MSIKVTIPEFDLDEEIKYEIKHYPEDFSAPEEHFDESIAKDVRKEMEWNSWAFCIVVVTATLHRLGITTSASLGCCSYEDEQQFIEEGGYFKDMKAEVREEMLSELIRRGFKLYNN